METIVTQLPLGFSDFGTKIAKESTQDKKRKNHAANKLTNEDRAFHDWYRFVLSYPPHLVRDYFKKFELSTRNTVIDPFCGTGTTLVEAKLAGIQSYGIEANIFPKFASSVKVNWDVSPEDLRTVSRTIAFETQKSLLADGIDDNSPFPVHDGLRSLRNISKEETELLLTNSISPLPLHKTLILLEILNRYKNSPLHNHLLLALANALVYKISNLRFGPEVGVEKVKSDVPVLSNWLFEVEKMAGDIQSVKGSGFPPADVILGDARDLGSLEENSIDAVITSPPYPNEKDYTRTTRLESVLLGFINTKIELRDLKRRLVRSNTRGVYKGDDDDLWIADFPEIQEIADAIEKRRIDLGKDSGFERMYSKVTRLYFGGMARHLSELRRVLRPGAQLAYVVGDQASYLRIMIRTGNLLAKIAVSLGYELIGIDLFRTRLATATREQLREEVVLLKWKG